MAKIIFGSWLVRYPLGGNLSWGLQYLIGLKELGHDVYFVEKAGYFNSCFDPEKGVMTNDCTYGVRALSELLNRFDLADRWCYVDYKNYYYGLSKIRVKEVFKGSDLFIDSGSHGSWAEESSQSSFRVLIDGEPGYTQMKWANSILNGNPIPEYDSYFTNGKNICSFDNKVPTLGINWKHVYSPVKTDFFSLNHENRNGSYSTIMNWKSHSTIQFNGKSYGQKDEEFLKFISLPKKVSVPMELAVSGKDVPKELLYEHGWLIKDAKRETLSFDSFCQYLSGCKGEFSICKNIFIATNNGWFSDKSAAFLASGKPVVLQDTGFSKHLPVGEGLFAINDVEEARDAIDNIENDYKFHSRKAREIAREYLEAKKIMGDFLCEIGI